MNNTNYAARAGNVLANATVSKFRPTYRLLVLSVTSEQQLAKIESEIWVTRLPSMSHLPPSIWRHRVTCLSPKNASAPWGQTVARWPPITISRVSYIQYLLACQKSQRSNSYSYNMVKSGLTWRRVFRRRHLGRRVTAVTCLRWPTVMWLLSFNFQTVRIMYIPWKFDRKLIAIHIFSDSSEH